MERNKLVNRIINGDALEVLKEFPSNFIDCVVTSPPYWLLRDYGIGPVIWDGDPNCSHKFNTVHRLHSPQGNQGQAMNNHPNGQSNFCLNCGAWRGQLGLEPTLDLYIKHLCNIFDEIYRVLKDTGSCWVNLGDTYTGNVGKRNGWTDEKGIYLTNKTEIIHQLPQKCLAGIPFRFAIEMVNRGWILRNTLIWHKPNCLPSSAKDRFTVDFEYLFFFVKNKKYWFETQYEPVKQTSIIRSKYARYKKGSKCENGNYAIHSDKPNDQKGNLFVKSTGRNKRCVWTISTKPFSQAHFAVYPEELCEIPIKAACPEFICKKCGKAREKIFRGKSSAAFNIRIRDVKEGRIKYSDRKASGREVQDYEEKAYGGEGKRFAGYTACSCHNATFEPGIVLDPFCGAGTTLLVAKKLDRNYIGIELNPEYAEMGRKRIDDYLSNRYKGKEKAIKIAQEN